MPKPRSGLEIDLNECCGQLIAIKDFSFHFPGSFSFDVVHAALKFVYNRPACYLKLCICCVFTYSMCVRDFTFDLFQGTLL